MRRLDPKTGATVATYAVGAEAGRRPAWFDRYAPGAGERRVCRPHGRTLAGAPHPRGSRRGRAARARDAGLCDLFADAAHSLGRVEVVWTGEAASAFSAEFELQPAAFTAAAGAFHDAGHALGSFAIALDSARHAATAAVDLFQHEVRAALVPRAATGGGLAAATVSGGCCRPRDRSTSATSLLATMGARARAARLSRLGSRWRSPATAPLRPFAKPWKAHLAMR
ncbi:hypothetical protein BH11MYX1_BH11MYX1_01980 [soil metagenome]